MNESARKHLHTMRFQALHTSLANRLYHQHCASIFETRDRFAKLASLIGASAVFMTLTAPDVAQYWSLLCFSGAAASLVFRWSEKARLASEKMIQYSAIQSNIQRLGEWDYTEEDVNKWNAELSSITEPTPNRILWDRACFLAASALNSPDPQALPWFDKHCPGLVLAIP